MLYELDGEGVKAEGDYWVADSATVVGNVLLKQNASVWFNAVVRGDNDLISIGKAQMCRMAQYCIPIRGFRSPLVPTSPLVTK